MILGIVGLHGAGKEEVAKILSHKGFTVLDMGMSSGRKWRRRG